MENEMTVEYLMENSSVNEPKFYPCRMMIAGAGNSGFHMGGPTIFRNREEYLAVKREGLEDLLRSGLNKSSQEKLFWILFAEAYKKTTTEHGEFLERLGFFIGNTNSIIDGEEITVINYWTKMTTMENIEADGRNKSVCAGCNTVKKLEELNKCAGCKNICYCSKECQKKDWKNHKINCQKK
jgi:hypothetical protein